MRTIVCAASAALAAACATAPTETDAGTARLPVIDMHMHAMPAEPPREAICIPFDPFPTWDQRLPYAAVYGEAITTPSCDDPIWEPETNEEMTERMLAVMKRANVVAGVLAGAEPLIDEWLALAPDRFIPGLRCIPTLPDCSVERLRALHEEGRLDVIAEITTQLGGIAPDDPGLEPYWALAEELDIPVGIHIGTPAPGWAYMGVLPGNRARLHSALTLEEVLVRHPSMRVYVMHAGYPMLDDMLAVLYTHPQVYVDVGIIIYELPREGFYRYLKALVDAGHGDRIMFGSDQLVWPETIERSIAVIEEAPFLSEQQKRDILYNNAARFLRLSEDEIAAHHAMATETE